MVTQAIACHRCGSTDVYKDGMSENGKQRYHCKSCGLHSRQARKGNAYPGEFKA